MCVFLVNVPILQTTSLKLATPPLLFLLADYQYILLSSYSGTEILILIFRCTFLQLLISTFLVAIHPNSVRTSEAPRTMAGTIGSCCSEDIRSSSCWLCCSALPLPPPLSLQGIGSIELESLSSFPPSVPPSLKHAQCAQVLLILKKANLPCSCHL